MIQTPRTQNFKTWENKWHALKISSITRPYSLVMQGQNLKSLEVSNAVTKTKHAFSKKMLRMSTRKILSFKRHKDSLVARIRPKLAELQISRLTWAGRRLHSSIWITSLWHCQESLRTFVWATNLRCKPVSATSRRCRRLVTTLTYSPSKTMTCKKSWMSLSCKMK